MPLFQCQGCGARENTALGDYWCAETKLCSECSTGKWHGEFDKIDAAAEGYFTDGQFIYGPHEVDEKTMRWKYNNSYKMVGRVQPITKPEETP